MVSNLGIEIDNEMSKLRPPVDLLGGFFNLLIYKCAAWLSRARRCLL